MQIRNRAEEAGFVIKIRGRLCNQNYHALLDALSTDVSQMRQWAYLVNLK